MEWNPSDAALAELCEDIVEYGAESRVERSVAFCPRSARHEFTCKLHDAATSVTACACSVARLERRRCAVFSRDTDLKFGLLVERGQRSEVSTYPAFVRVPNS